MNELVIESSKIKVTPYAVEFDGAPTIKEWHQAVQAIGKLNSMCQWYLGDLMAYAESPVTGWGESKYDDLMAATGYDYQTLMIYASVARRFTPSFREGILAKRLSTSKDVLFAHFQTVASVDDNRAVYFLEMVRDAGWNNSKLREEVRRYKNGGLLPDPDNSTEYMLKLSEWEIRKIRNDYAGEPDMAGVCARIDFLLGEG